MDQAILNALRNGKNYSISTGNMSMTLAAGGHQLITIENPSGSGHNIIVYDIAPFTSVAPSSISVFVNPTTLTGAISASAIPLNIGGGVADADTSLKYKVSSTAMSGTNPVMYPVPEGKGIAAFLLAPGNTVGFDVSYAVTVSLSAAAYLMFYYIREPITN
jgi:hypothetical protein